MIAAALIWLPGCGDDDGSNEAAREAPTTVTTEVVVPRSEPEAGTWDTWIISSREAVEVPPPPTGEAEDVQRDELVQLAAERTPEIEEIVRRWDDSPVGAEWAEMHLDIVAERAKDPVNASRGYALMSVAVYDAVVATWHWKYEYDREAPAGIDALVEPGPDPSYPSEHAAIAGAASRMLAYLNPELPAERFEVQAEEAALSRLQGGANYRSDIEAGLALGRAVADQVIAQAEHDGHHAQWDQLRPAGIGIGPEYWQPPPGSVSPPTQPLAGSWDTWVLESGDQFRPGPPPAYGTPEFLAQAQAVLDVSASLTDEQKAIADRWAGGQGTPLPPGIWNQITLDQIRQSDMTAPEAARALALVNVALADAGISCWDTKFTYWSPRPVNAIHDLGLDPAWTPYLRTPSFPSYSSGHSTYSGAASVVLAYLFPDRADQLSDMAEEAALSRLYGGIHYPIDNEVGLRTGRQIGERVVEKAKTDGADG